MKILNLLNK